MNDATDSLRQAHVICVLQGRCRCMIRERGVGSKWLAPGLLLGDECCDYLDLRLNLAEECVLVGAESGVRVPQ